MRAIWLLPLLTACGSLPEGAFFGTVAFTATDGFDTANTNQTPYEVRVGSDSGTITVTGLLGCTFEFDVTRRGSRVMADAALGTGCAVDLDESRTFIAVTGDLEYRSDDDALFIDLTGTEGPVTASWLFTP